MLIFNGQVLQIGTDQPPFPGAAMWRRWHDDSGYIIQPISGENIVVDYISGQRIWIIGRSPEINTIVAIREIRTKKE